DRFEVGLTLTGDLDNNELEARLQFSWFFRNSRNYRSFRPGDVDFRDVKTRRATRVNGHHRESE
ncbi:MAG: hypothetical protein QG656_2673, partial [Candidatus Hydrogenedentes bacterium]|nr:hypothetical protein [Candidatus Hydrogenedentota bacterium]